GLDVTHEIFAVLKVELVLSALLCRTGGGNALGGRVAQDRGAELLVDQDAGLSGGRAAGQRRPEAVIDDLLGAGDFGGLGTAERRLPAEQPALEGTAVIERQNIERPIVSPRHQAAAL